MTKIDMNSDVFFAVTLCNGSRFDYVYVKVRSICSGNSNFLRSWKVVTFYDVDAFVEYRFMYFLLFTASIGTVNLQYGN